MHVAAETGEAAFLKKHQISMHLAGAMRENNTFFSGLQSA
jgi:hypothetical protein